MVVLDTGCGFGEWGFLIRTRKSGFPYLIGVDIWRSHLERLCALKVYDELIRVYVPYFPFREKSVDISLACEILEHLPKSVGYKLLRELERVSRKMIVVSTPLSWPQEEIYGNPHEKHVSEWEPQELIRYGYEVKVTDAMPLPKTLKPVDRIRRVIFRLPNPKLVIAYKYLSTLKSI
jgi:SAM-dependent methyltransferase